jgi:hypothetical protein
MTKAIAITQQGNKKLFLIGDYQATLWEPNGATGWFAEYFKGSRKVLNSESSKHPVMPDTYADAARAHLIVERVIGSLHANLPVPNLTFSTRKTKKSPKKLPKRQSPKLVTPSEVLEDLLNHMDDSWTVRIPSGKPAALRVSKVQICDENGDVACEIPYPVYRNVCCIH